MAAPLTMAELPPELRAWLGPVRALTGPAQGATSDVAFAEGERGAFVVKRSARQPYRDWLRREYAVLRALEGSGLPVPQAYLHIEAGGAGWLLMERLPGRPLSEALGECRDDAERAPLLTAFGAFLARLHRCPPPAALAGDRPWLDAMLATAASYLARYPVDGTPELLERLRCERPAPVALRLLHGDCTTENVLVADGAISGMIDWGLGAIGDPRYDLALATQPQAGTFESPADVVAFYAGYGGEPLSGAERAYFDGLYEFF